MIPTCDIRIGDARERLRELPAQSVQCIVTSPPYWGLRSYGTVPLVWGGILGCGHSFGGFGKRHRSGPQGRSGQRADRDTSAQNAVGDVATGQFCEHCGAWRGELGHEPTPELFIEHLMEVMDECRRVLTDDGVIWVNMGDCHAGSGRGPMSKRSSLRGNGHQGGGPKREALEGNRPNMRGSTLPAGLHEGVREAGQIGRAWTPPPAGLKDKDLVGQPWMVAFAMRARSWHLRLDIIWDKPCPMPESVKDRPTKAHEYIFLLSKSPRYFYNAEAIKEPVTGGAHPRGGGVNPKAVGGWLEGPGTHKAIDRHTPEGGQKFRSKQNESFSRAVTGLVETRNKRSVWRISPEPFDGAHYATFPRDLVRPCILAGSRPGDVVLDPFGGSGTVGSVALEYGRNAILIDLNPANEALMRDRLAEHRGQGVLAV